MVPVVGSLRSRLLVSAYRRFYVVFIAFVPIRSFIIPYVHALAVRCGCAISSDAMEAAAKDLGSGGQVLCTGIVILALKDLDFHGPAIRRLASAVPSKVLDVGSMLVLFTITS